MPLLTLSNLHTYICLLVSHAPPIQDHHQFCENRDHVCFPPPLCTHCLRDAYHITDALETNQQKPVKWLIKCNFYEGQNTHQIKKNKIGVDVGS